MDTDQHISTSGLEGTSEEKNKTLTGLKITYAFFDMKPFFLGKGDEGASHDKITKKLIYNSKDRFAFWGR